MKHSILRNLLLSFIGLGIVMGLIFPFFASFFVEWKPGMWIWFSISALGAGATVGLLNYWLVNRVLLSKLRRICEVAQAISNKDITHHCSLESDDMVGEIITSFNKMSSNLCELISEVARMGSSVNQDANTIDGLMSRVHKNFNSQQASVEGINASTQTLFGTVAEISDSANQVATAARRAAELASSGGQIVQETIREMQQINDSVTQSAAAVDDLGHKSDEIGAIVAVIKGIAEQTNLLALNAAIEAARAGEQGRGFAVVADEVRNLAEKTAEATKQISSMITSIQSETSHAISAMRNGTDMVKAGVDKASEAGVALEEIVQSVQGVSAMVERIAAGAKSQNQMVSAVRNQVTEISQIVDNTAADTQSGQETSKALAKLSARLDSVLHQFKLRQVA